MSKEYSIADARNMFPTLIRESENTDIQVTRRGKPVAAIISIEEYLKFKKTKQNNFWASYQSFITEETAAEVTGEEFDNIRASDSGREENPWL